MHREKEGNSAFSLLFHPPRVRVLLGVPGGGLGSAQKPAAAQPCTPWLLFVRGGTSSRCNQLQNFLTAASAQLHSVLSAFRVTGALEAQGFIYFLVEKWRSSISLTPAADRSNYVRSVCINTTFPDRTLGHLQRSVIHGAPPHVSFARHHWRTAPSYILNLSGHMIPAHSSAFCLNELSQHNLRRGVKDGIVNTGRCFTGQIQTSLRQGITDGAVLEDASVRPRCRQTAESLGSIFSQFSLFNLLYYSVQQQLLVCRDKKSCQTFLYGIEPRGALHPH